MTRAAIYARVSSAAQRDAHTIENQLRALPAYVASQGWVLVDTYVDDGRSAKAGRLEAREGFARLVRDADAKRFDVVVVVDIDRLTRTDDMRERAEILGPFQRNGIQIVTPSGGALDLRTMLGELYVTLQAIVAAEENRKRAERIKAGKARAIAEGRKPAGPTPYGLAYSRAAGEWSIDEVRADIVREIHRRIADGDSCAAIADDLHARGAPSPRGPWERHKVWDIARSRHTVGEWLADKRQRLVVKVPAIIDAATWQVTQRALEAHGKRGLIKTKHVYLLEGLAVCGVCGSPIAIRSPSTNPRGYLNPAAYVCRRRKLGRRDEARCVAPVVRVADLDARVWAAVSAALAGPDLAAAVAKHVQSLDAEHHDWQADAVGYRRHLERLDGVESGLLARFRRGIVSNAALDKELTALNRERAAIRAQLATAERALHATPRPTENTAADWLAALRTLAEEATASPLARYQLVQAIVSKGGAVVHGPRVTLDLAIDSPRSERTAQPSLAVVPG
jgi:site-specific DNA recombinase